MSEFNIEFEILTPSCYTGSCTMQHEAFLDDFIAAIESFGMQFGGGSDLVKGIHKGVIEVMEQDVSTIKKRVQSIQKWLLNHPASPVILYWCACPESL
ncbi:MAG: hypothetical protein ACRC2T_03270 [Thermoguttaceae bacterium]